MHRALICGQAQYSADRPAGHRQNQTVIAGSGSGFQISLLAAGSLNGVFHAPLDAFQIVAGKGMKEGIESGHRSALTL